MSSHLLQNYARYPLVLTRGKGCWLYDIDKRRYLDLMASYAGGYGTGPDRSPVYAPAVLQ